MKLINTPKGLSFKDRGRPNKYPFNYLEPGKTLVIKIMTDKDIGRTKSALYQYVKSNKLDWVCSTRVIKNEIFVNRLK